MNAFQPPTQSSTGNGGGFNFSFGGGSTASSNPFASQNGAVSTPPPPSFSFGQEQNNSGGGLFGGNSSFSSTIGNGNSQPQQNGFNPSTTMFGDQNKTTNATPTFSFGQITGAPAQQNGFTPSTATTSSFPSFGKANSEASHQGFGQSQQSDGQSASNMSFFRAGQVAQDNSSKVPGISFNFGQTSAQPQQNGTKSFFGTDAQSEQTQKSTTGNPFASFGQQNQQEQSSSSRPLFGSSSQADSTPKPSGSTDVPNAAQSGKGLFGSSLTPAPNMNGGSVFDSVNQKKNAGITPGMFTMDKDQTPARTTSSNPFAGFGQQSQQNIPKAAVPNEDSSKPASLFASASQPQANGVKPGIFGSTSTSAPVSSPDSGASQQKSQSLFGASQSGQDTSMTTPESTPQKSLSSNPFTSQAAAPVFGQNSSDQSESSGTKGADLFSRITYPNNQAQASTPAFKSIFTPATPLSSAHSTEASQVHERAEPSAARGGELFSPAANAPATAVKHKPVPAPPSSTANGPSAAPWISHAPSALQQTRPSMTARSTSNKSATATMQSNPEHHQATLKGLNEGLKTHLQRQDPTADWSTIFRYYLEEAARLQDKPKPSFNAHPALLPAAAGSSIGSKAAPTANVFGQASGSDTTAKQSAEARPAAFASATPKTSASSNVFSSAAYNTPATSSAENVWPPQTAPVNKNKRLFPDDADQPQPATEKRSRIEYPKLPDNASETAKMFQAALDRPAVGQSSGFKPSPAGPTPSNAGTSSGFKPSTAVFTPSTSSTGPSASLGMPTVAAPAAGSNNFLAAFGRKASVEEEKDKKKRKMQDYDSDEETEEAWAARDAKEQEAKRQKILEVAKTGTGFVLSGATTPASGGTPAPESGEDARSEEANETSAGQGKSLFDRVSRDAPATAPSKPSFFFGQTSGSSAAPTSNLFGSKTSEASGAPTSSLFNFTQPKAKNDTSENDKAEAEKDQGTGDHTWKPNTPIKFGANTTTDTQSTTPAAPPPRFGNLFGTTPQTAKADGLSHLNVPSSKPTIGFDFGVPSGASNTSRASTPGLTTDGEGASTAGEGDDPDDAAPPEEQVEDQTGLGDYEKQNEDLLFTVPTAKCKKYEDQKGERAWVDKGLGPLYILKHKQTGKTRVLLKVPPYGTPKMNFSVMKDMLYEVTGKAGKMVQGAFVDTLESKTGSQITKWLILVGKPEDAAEIARVLMEQRTGS